MKKMFRISEILWLIVGIGCVGATVYYFAVLKDTRQGIFFAGLTFIAAIMFMVRRRMRIRYEKYEKENPKNNGR